MKACLDPEANLKAPSLEKSVLTGSGVLYLIAAYLATGAGEFGDSLPAMIDLESLPSLDDVLDSFF